MAASAAGVYQPSPLSPAVSLKVSHSGTTAQTGVYVAADRGYFKDEGLDVELVNINDIAQSVQTVATSQAAFLVALPDL